LVGSRNNLKSVSILQKSSHSIGEYGVLYRDKNCIGYINGKITIYPLNPRQPIKAFKENDQEHDKENDPIDLDINHDL